MQDQRASKLGWKLHGDSAAPSRVLGGYDTLSGKPNLHLCFQNAEGENSTHRTPFHLINLTLI